MLGNAGCATSRPLPEKPYLLAVRYDAEPRWLAVPEDDRAAVLQRDLRAVAEWGFNAVAVRHVEVGDERMVLDTAQEAGLRAVIASRSLEHFVVTGVPSMSTDFVERATRGITAHPAFYAVGLDEPRGAAAGRRLDDVRSRLRDGGIDVLVVGAGDRRSDDRQCLAIVDVACLWNGPPGDAKRRMLQQFHDQLESGRCGGLIVDRFFRLPGDPPGLERPDSPLVPAQRSALAELLARAQNWGPRLRGLAPSPGVVSADGGDDLAATLFGDNPVRYALVRNGSADRFLRTEFPLRPPKNENGWGRAVEVPPSGAVPAGRVILAKNGQLTLPVELAPGDAVLYEVFRGIR